MLALIAYLTITVTVLMLGMQVLRIVRLAPTDGAELGLASLVIGHALLALLVLALGLLGYLTWWALAHLLLACALLGLRSLNEALALMAQLVGAVRLRLQRAPLRWSYLAIALIVIAQLPAALAPPTPTDWDGVSEHLAQAKQYARDGRIRPLWYDHHSHFPATVQMLYTVAHVFRIPQGSKLFHWGFGVMALGAVMLAGRRLLAPAAGTWGALVLATTPGFAWLMGVAYVDLATIACSVLALHFLARWLRDGQAGHLWLSALMIGAAAGTKMQALALLGVLLAVILITGKLRAAALRRAAGYLALALLVCGPWYLKSYLWTGNPVYPFAYELFGGRMWSAERAEQYRHAQRGYGKGELPPLEQFRQLPPLQRAFAGPRRPLNLLLAPINVTLDPSAFTVPLTPLGAFATDSIGPLWLALLPLLLLLRRPPPVRLMLWVLLPLWLWWLWSMQLTRYLLPTLALVAPAAGWAALQALHGGRALGAVVRWVLRLWTVVALGLMTLYVAPQLPAALGLVDDDEYLAGIPLVAVSRFINETAPEDARIALYGEPRGYYLDRDYLWAEPGHSALIDYERVDSADDLVAEWRRLGVTHVVVNLAQFPDIRFSDDPVARLIGDGVEQGALEQLAPPPVARPYLVLRLPQR
ncbi:MAG: glycosyltransferase family 39 protein [Armatimonadota bacterium]